MLPRLINHHPPLLRYRPLNKRHSVASLVRIVGALAASQRRDGDTPTPTPTPTANDVDETGAAAWFADSDDSATVTGTTTSRPSSSIDDAPGGE
jgi:hypothetical protein